MRVSLQVATSHVVAASPLPVSALLPPSSSAGVALSTKPHCDATTAIAGLATVSLRGSGWRLRADNSTIVQQYCGGSNNKNTVSILCNLANFACGGAKLVCHAGSPAVVRCQMSGASITVPVLGIRRQPGRGRRCGRW